MNNGTDYSKALFARAMRESTINIIQDGREFYNDDSGAMVFRAETPVPDSDIKAAEAARRKFQGWAKRMGVDIVWA